MPNNRRNFVRIIGAVMAMSFSFSCASTPKAPASQPALNAPPVTPIATPPPLPAPEVVQIPVVVSPKESKAIPKGSRIIITDISGDCVTEVKDALVRRLIDNTDYDVLAREHLRQILVESEETWSGPFDTETAAKIGRLMGASLFIVGKVISCGPSDTYSQNLEEESEFRIFAVLQIIDLETGRVILSSATEGKYSPTPTPLLLAENSLDQDTIDDIIDLPITEIESIGNKSRTQRIKDIFSRNSNQVDQPLDKQPRNSLASLGNYPKIKAAEDLANGFADKFFSRPSWENVEMWKNPSWHYGDSLIRYVKLGHCPRAVQFLEEMASKELPLMNEREISEYTHNYGVALLCTNQPTEAMEKLRSAYRMGYQQTTLKMLGLAAKILEWSLEVEVDTQPETRLLAKRATPRKYKEETVPPTILPTSKSTSHQP